MSNQHEESDVNSASEKSESDDDLKEAISSLKKISKHHKEHNTKPVEKKRKFKDHKSFRQIPHFKKFDILGIHKVPVLHKKKYNSRIIETEDFSVCLMKF